LIASVLRSRRALFVFLGAVFADEALVTVFVFTALQGLSLAARVAAAWRITVRKRAFGSANGSVVTGEAIDTRPSAGRLALLVLDTVILQTLQDRSETPKTNNFAVRYKKYV